MSDAPVSRLRLAEATSDRYRLEKHLGSGGMGEVYAAFDRRLRMPVALKIATDAPLSRRRLVREARLLNRFVHPAIVSVIDTGTTRTGRPCFSMELVDGLTLRESVRREGPMPEARVAAVLLRLCDALSAVHGAGLVHHDVTPGNVMLRAPRVAGRGARGLSRGTRDDGDVCLIDFGIARAAEATRTATAVVGTQGYMPPEVTIGAPSDHRADLYALGALGTFLLDGALLDASQRFTKEGAAMIAARGDSPLRGVLARCLEQEPSVRFATAAEVAAALSEIPVAPAEPLARTDQEYHPRRDCSVEILRNGRSDTADTTEESPLLGRRRAFAQLAVCRR